MDPDVSVQKQNFTRNPEKLAKVPGAREETKSHFHWQFLGIRQILREVILESLHVYTTQIRNKCDYWKSSAQSKGRLLCCIVAIRTEWKLMGRFLGMVHLSAKRQRAVIWWEDVRWKTFWTTIWITDYSIWFTAWVSVKNYEGPVKNPSIWKESLTWIVSRIRIVRGGHLEGWRIGCTPRGVEDDKRIGNLLRKIQCERDDISHRKRRIYFPIADGRIKPLGGDQDLRTSPLIRQRPIQGEIHLDFLRESKESFPPCQDSFPNVVEEINDS